MTIAIPESVDGLPTIAGHEADLEKAIRDAASQEVFRPESKIDFGRIKSACAIALHMHQPLIPAGGRDLRTAEIISNLKYMMDNQGIGDNHNAGVFVWCYKRIGEFIPQLIDEGKEPRVMLEYSGTLFHGLRQMGLNDVFDALKRVTCDPAYRRGVEWLGCPWGHAVAPSTPVQDYRLHVKAWQHHFAGIFGIEALRAGARLFAVGDGAAEPSGRRLRVRQDAARLRLSPGCWCRSTRSSGRKTATARRRSTCRIASSAPTRRARPPRSSRLIKTQGSDTKLVAQMQPYYEAKSLSRWELAGKSVPPLVTQIADGENGGVMMNEFPGKFIECRTRGIRLGDAVDERHRVPGVPVRLGDQAIRPAGRPADPPEADLGQDQAGRRPGEAGEGRSTSARRRITASTWKAAAGPTTSPGCAATTDLLGPMEKMSSHFNEEVLKRKKADDRRAALSQRPVPPDGGRNQLLPLLGPGRLDRLRQGNLPPRR